MKTMLFSMTALLSGCLFLTPATARSESGAGNLTGDVELQRSPAADTTASNLNLNWCVEYTYYAKKKNGVVTIIFSGKEGPYDRAEAQSRVDQKNADEKVEKGVRYYYKARVVPR